MRFSKKKLEIELFFGCVVASSISKCYILTRGSANHLHFAKWYEKRSHFLAITSFRSDDFSLFYEKNIKNQADLFLLSLLHHFRSAISWHSACRLPRFLEGTIRTLLMMTYYFFETVLIFPMNFSLKECWKSSSCAFFVGNLECPNKIGRRNGTFVTSGKKSWSEFIWNLAIFNEK